MIDSDDDDCGVSKNAKAQAHDILRREGLQPDEIVLHRELPHRPVHELDTEPRSPASPDSPPPPLWTHCNKGSVTSVPGRSPPPGTSAATSSARGKLKSWLRPWVEGMVMNLASLLAGTVTNPFGDGFFQGPKEAPLEAASACPGIYGKGAYPGYAGDLLVDPASGASYNFNGAHGRRFLLPALLDPSTSSCSTST